MIIDIVKIFTASSLAFVVGMLITPALTHYLYKFRAWKKKAGKVAPDGRSTPIFNKVHEERETSTPRMGGIVIWASAFITIIGIWFVSKVFPSDITTKLDFLSRNQTWIPLFTLIAGSIVGMIDDILEVKGNGNYIAGGLSLKRRLLVVGVISFFVAWWFFVKLGVASIGFPFLGDIALGFWFIPFFMLVTLAVYAGGVIDGIDGLSGGVFAAIFGGADLEVLGSLLWGNKKNFEVDGDSTIRLVGVGMEKPHEAPRVENINPRIGEIGRHFGSTEDGSLVPGNEAGGPFAKGPETKEKTVLGVTMPNLATLPVGMRRSGSGVP